MAERVRAWVDQQLSAAERNKTCLAVCAGLELRRMRHAVSTGQAVEVAPFVFARAPYWDDLKPGEKALHVIRALQELHPNWVFAGPSAALAFGLSVSNRFLDKVWVATSRKTHQRELSYRRSIVVSRDSTVVVGGLRVTSFERTVGDCLRIMDFRSGLAVADSALRVAGCSQDALIAGLERACAKTPGLAQMRYLCALADPRAESGGESIARGTMLELGLMAPDLQRAFDNPDNPDAPYRVDFAWDIADKCIAGELDGLEKYVSEDMTMGKGLADIINSEHRRQSHIEANHRVLRFVRFGYSDVMNERSFLNLLLGCGVPRTYALDERVRLAGGTLRCR